MAKKKVESPKVESPDVESGPEKVEDVSAKVESKSSSHDEDIAKHPKFAKFNSHGGK